MGKSDLDERGRVTIPKDIRDKVGLKEGDQVRLSTHEEWAMIEKAISI